MSILKTTTKKDNSCKPDKGLLSRKNAKKGDTFLQGQLTGSRKGEGAGSKAQHTLKGVFKMELHTGLDNKLMLEKNYNIRRI
mmetsp:Transcript_9843/g.26728  ORF Transcript_9843/g.26728 Transcript_9843/m.26728 type:complete len:82 (-) Transcript_9843:7161-7406(-)